MSTARKVVKRPIREGMVVMFEQFEGVNRKGVVLEWVEGSDWLVRILGTDSETLTVTERSMQLGMVRTSTLAAEAVARERVTAILRAWDLHINEHGDVGSAAWEQPRIVESLVELICEVNS